MTIFEPQLFGAPAGQVSGITCQITNYETGSSGVILHVHQRNRQQLLTLYVTCLKDQGVNTVIGAMTPLLQRGNESTVNFCRRSLWALHDRLGRMGYEVRIERCGNRPKH